MKFALRISTTQDDRFTAEGKANTWTLTEVFEGTRRGDTVTLTGIEVRPTPPPGKAYSLDVLTMRLSKDGQALVGTWVDAENSKGAVEVTRQIRSSREGDSAPADMPEGARDESVSADAKEAIETAMRTGSTKAFLTRAVPSRMTVWQEAAAKENPEALWLLGCCHDNGIGVEARDPSRAFECYLQAAEQEYGPALNDVGLCYAKGSGTTKNLSKAVDYYKRAAEKGRAGAWYNLGSMYEQGLGGLPKDIDKAVQCYRTASNLGYGPAEKALVALGR